MDMFLTLSREQFNWLRKVVTAIYGEKVQFAKDWEDGVATVIVFENGSYIWCLPSEAPYVQGNGTVHFPRFTDRDAYNAAHRRLEQMELMPTAIADVSGKTGVTIAGETVGQYVFLSFNIKGEGLCFELCMEPEHAWATLSDDAWEF
ncbi:MAG: hypothetical protein FWG38_01045 [Defluviitaleaceae bacterium]|nr:hypothetical protein [Defluviitaleaceae bacterium]